MRRVNEALRKAGFRMRKTWYTAAMSGDTKIVGLWRDKHKTGEAAALPTQRADLGVNFATDDMMSADDEPFEGASPTSQMIHGGAIASSDERRVGNECVRPGISRGSRSNKKNK